MRWLLRLVLGWKLLHTAFVSMPNGVPLAVAGGGRLVQFGLILFEILSPRDQQQLLLPPLQDTFPLLGAFGEPIAQGHILEAVVPQQIVEVSKDVGTPFDLVATASVAPGGGRRRRVRPIVTARVELFRVDVVVVGGYGGEARPRTGGSGRFWLTTAVTVETMTIT